MIRNVVAVLLGYALWSGLWLGGNRLLLPEAADAVAAGEPFIRTGPLALAVALSVACSLVSGFATGAIAKRRAPVCVLAVLLLVTGIAVQASAWDLMPVGYHLAFLALLVPMTGIGGLRGARSARTAPVVA